MLWPQFWLQTISEVRSDLIRSPILGVRSNFYFIKNLIGGLLLPKKPFFSFGHKMGTHFGHTYKKIDPPMLLPIENEHHMQGLAVVATLILASSDLRGQIWPHRAPILGGPEQLLFYATFWLETILTLFWPFFTFGHRMGTHFGHPDKKFDPPMLDPWSPGVSLPVLGWICPAVWPSIKDKQEASRQNDIYSIYKMPLKNVGLFDFLLNEETIWRNVYMYRLNCLSSVFHTW